MKLRQLFAAALILLIVFLLLFLPKLKPKAQVKEKEETSPKVAMLDVNNPISVTRKTVIWQFVQRGDSENEALLSGFFTEFEWDLHNKDSSFKKTSAYVTEVLAKRSSDTSLPTEEPWRTVEARDNLVKEHLYTFFSKVKKDIENKDQSFALTLNYGQELKDLVLPSLPLEFQKQTIVVRWEDPEGKQVLPPENKLLTRYVSVPDETVLKEMNGFVLNLKDDTVNARKDFHRTHEFIDGKEW